MKSRPAVSLKRFTSRKLTRSERPLSSRWKTDASPSARSYAFCLFLCYVDVFYMCVMSEDCR
jgi:hypothetical protein